jgi:hypothetical protein
MDISLVPACRRAARPQRSCGKSTRVRHQGDRWNRDGTGSKQRDEAGLAVALAPQLRGGGFGIAALAYALEWYSAVLAYPIDSGGRPLHSWPAFVFFPFSVGILAAAIAGLIALFVQGGLTSLHHPVFAIAEVERASQDAFLLALVPADDDAAKDLQALLTREGAEETWEIVP